MRFGFWILNYFMLREKYQKEIIPKMKEKFGYKSDMAVPRIKKVTVNIGIGKIEEKDSKDKIAEDLTMIIGQKLVFTSAKKAISGFKLRKGAKIGCKATLRRNRMYDFLEKFIGVALPRTRDFRGIPQKSFDKNGNLTLGVKEHIIFPEISTEKISKIFGLEVTITTTAKTKEEGMELLRLFKFPLQK